MILQTALPYDLDPRRLLPGISPTRDWLLQDEAYGAQMAERERLLADHRAAVLSLRPEGREAAQELMETVIAEAEGWPGFVRQGKAMRCPDGRIVALDGADPLGTLGHLVQEDLCLMQPGPDGHVLTGAVLCFPASWLLSEKIGRPLVGIHAPVEEYDADLARRVQRLFDAVRVGVVLMRHNVLWYHAPDLFQPRGMDDRRDIPHHGAGDYLRTERQTLRRLPRTGAVVFGIHTYVLHRSAPVAAAFATAQKSPARAPGEA